MSGLQSIESSVTINGLMARLRPRRLSEDKGWRLVDLDEYVENVISKLEDLKEIMYLDTIDSVIIIMLYYKWDTDKA